MKLIDLHCDTIWKIHSCKQSQGLKKNHFHVDIQKLQKADSVAQFFALFINQGEVMEKKITPWSDFLDKHQVLMDQLALNSDEIALAKNGKDLDSNRASGKISAFMTIEEGGVLEGQMHRLEEAYAMGVRLITLTWNYINSIGFPNNLCITDYPNQRLTAFGVEVVERMNELGMIVDVSHLSDQGFYHVHEISKKPYIASHSCARVLQNHPRNLTDDMLQVLGNDGGIVGLNFLPIFLDPQAVSSPEKMVEHILHIENKAGIDAVAIGTDFDGIDGYLEIENISQMDKLLSALKKAGYSDDRIEKIWYRNARRIIDEVMR